MEALNKHWYILLFRLRDVAMDGANLPHPPRAYKLVKDTEERGRKYHVSTWTGCEGVQSRSSGSFICRDASQKKWHLSWSVKQEWKKPMEKECWGQGRRGEILGGDKFWHIQKKDGMLLVRERERNEVQLAHRFQRKKLWERGRSGCTSARKPPLV